ncbi:MAG: ABC transporter permease [Betaproteobacteria bacterium]|nr:ABC transporter permease [Betaproteobacteria bacterium]MDH3437674.1 ABC transporter permease [Betaproteobacteria bacterium]
MTAIARPLLGQRFVLFHTLVLGPLRENPGRTALAIVAIALGVALGVAVHLINASALNEFEVAARHLAGEADLVIRGPRAGFDQALYPKLARLPQVEAANPAVDLEVPLVGRPGSLRIIGFDPLQAARVQPSLVPEDYGLLSDLFDANAVLLSAAAAEWLGLETGAELRVRVGTRPVRLKVIGALPAGVYRQRLGVMDIASAQWRLAQLGRLNRIALRLKGGTDVQAFRRELEALLPAGVHAVTPDSEGEHRAALTRAYRLNLDMLALIALFTGAFLVFSSQVLVLLRRRSQFALLRAMGLTRVDLAGYLVAEGAAVGIIGAALGVVAGYALARAALLLVGADLGAGYFRSIVADVAVEPRVLVVFFALGILFAVLGTLGPAWEAAHRAPARALRAGDEEESLEHLRSPAAGLGATAAGLLLTLAPAVNGLPIAGYAAIALILFGAVLLMPRFAAALFSCLPVPAGAPSAVAIAQLKATPRRSAISIAAIVISFSFMVSMLIMVSSFRVSLETWLGRMLPADLYLRAARSGETAFLTPKEQVRIASIPGFERVQFLRAQTVLLTPERPAVNLHARPIEAAAADKVLPLIAPPLIPPAGAPPPVWISEVASDLHGLRQGDILRLPLGGKLILCTVAGIWRDYARQNGAIVIDRGLYTRFTGDHLANEAAIWLRDGVNVTEAQQALRRQLPKEAMVEITSTREVRAASLRIFDRTFAITYALEIAAVVIGLFGVGASFGAQALARRREFGVLRHLGMTRQQIGAMLGQEGAIVAALGVAAGLVVGWVVGLVLIHVINRQSFHWSMELHMPWAPLAGFAALVVAAAALTAVWSGRAAMKEDVVRAVREDW